MSKTAVTGVLRISLSTTRSTNRPPDLAWIDLYRKYRTTDRITASTPVPNELWTSLVIDRTSIVCRSSRPAGVTTISGWTVAGCIWITSESMSA